jgi:hypothetical protein
MVRPNSPDDSTSDIGGTKLYQFQVDIIAHANELARRAELGTGGFGPISFHWDAFPYKIQIAR